MFTMYSLYSVNFSNLVLKLYCPSAMRTLSLDGLHLGCCIFLLAQAYTVFCKLLHEYPTEEYPDSLLWPD